MNSFVVLLKFKVGTSFVTQLDEENNLPHSEQKRSDPSSLYHRGTDSSTAETANCS